MTPEEQYAALMGMPDSPAALEFARRLRTFRRLNAASLLALLMWATWRLMREETNEISWN